MQCNAIRLNLAPLLPNPAAKSRPYSQSQQQQQRQTDMEFIEIITDKLERVLLVQNGGREVITIHS